jgi:hypothetical protein
MAAFRATPKPIDLVPLVVDAVQKRLDNFAQTRGYDGILSACTYAGSKVEKFRIEGDYCVEVRDQHWAACWRLLAEVESGVRPMPGAVSEVVAQMPPLVWPDEPPH